MSLQDEKDKIKSKMGVITLQYENVNALHNELKHNGYHIELSETIGTYSYPINSSINDNKKTMDSIKEVESIARKYETSLI